MAKEYAKAFYNSTEWQQCRDSYIKSVNGLCENCMAHGLIVPGYELHHIIHITPDNINDPAITLNWDNLIYLCHACHDEVHNRYQKRKHRYFVDENGRVQAPP